jgi:hypothetical protein
VTVACEAETVEVLRELLNACPFPGSWHPGHDRIAVVFDDFRCAVEALETAGGDDEDRDASLAVAGARSRLEGLPRPEGQHPYLDTILPTLEAMELALDLLDQDPSAAAAFARLRASVGPTAAA